MKLNLFVDIYLLIVSPENVIGRLGRVLDEAGQIDRAADIDVHLGAAENHGRRFFISKKKKKRLFEISAGKIKKNND